MEAKLDILRTVSGGRKDEGGQRQAVRWPRASATPRRAGRTPRAAVGKSRRCVDGERGRDQQQKYIGVHCDRIPLLLGEFSELECAECSVATLSSKRHRRAISMFFL